MKFKCFHNFGDIKGSTSLRHFEFIKCIHVQDETKYVIYFVTRLLVHIYCPRGNSSVFELRTGCEEIVLKRQVVPRVKEM